MDLTLLMPTVALVYIMMLKRLLMMKKATVMTELMIHVTKLTTSIAIFQRTGRSKLHLSCLRTTLFSSARYPPPPISLPFYLSPWYLKVSHNVISDIGIFRFKEEEKYQLVLKYCIRIDEYFPGWGSQRDQTSQVNFKRPMIFFVSSIHSAS